MSALQRNAVVSFLVLTLSLLAFAGKPNSCVVQPVYVPNFANACSGTGSGCYDSTFGVGGIAPFNPPQSIDAFNDWIALQGTNILATKRNSIQRLDSAGNLDTTFASAGTLTVPDANTDGGMAITGFVVDGTGRIVVAGNLFVRRYNQDGSPDTSFGTNGTVSLTGVTSTMGLALQADGKLVLPAATGSKASPRYAAIRLNPDGTYDSGFGTSGITKSSITGAPRALALQTINGNQLAVLVGDGPTAVRLLSSGKIDNSFGPSGNGVSQTTFLGANAPTLFVVVEPDNRLVILSEVTPPNCAATFDYGFWGLTASGLADNSFGASNPASIGAGRIDVNFVPVAQYSNDRPKGLAVETYVDVDNVTRVRRIIAAGWASTSNTTFQRDFAFLALDSAGNFDSTFGDGSGVSILRNTGGTTASALTIQSDGKPVASGILDGGHVIVRLNP
jgi:uncharacterized delta-60 repeat protein